MNFALIASMSRSTEGMLEFAGWSVIILCMSLIIFSYLRRRSDLITAWNCVLFGCTINIGVGCLEAVDRTESFYQRYISFNFPDADYRDALTRNLVFLATMLVMYYGIKLFRKFGHNRFQVCPEWSGTMFVWVISICSVFMLCVSFISIPFFKEVVFNLAQKAAVFAGVFSFYAWYRNRSSVPMLFLSIAILGVAALFCIKVSPGRRLLLTVFAAAPFVAYWLKWRYSNPVRVLLLSSLAGATIALGGLSYAIIRHFDTHGNRFQRSERTISNIIPRLGEINMAGIQAQLDGWKHLLAQANYEYALLTKRIVDSGTAEVHTLNSLHFLSCYAIPRRMWEDKPVTIALDLPRRYLKLLQPSVWGVGPAGHSYYEGGYLALFAYAGVLVFIVRLIDEPLLREPNNPFFIATLVASFSYLINIIRGDFGTHYAELFECFLFAILLNWSARLFTAHRKLAFSKPGQLRAKLAHPN